MKTPHPNSTLPKAYNYSPQMLDNETHELLDQIRMKLVQLEGKDFPQRYLEVFFGKFRKGISKKSICHLAALVLQDEVDALLKKHG